MRRVAVPGFALLLALVLAVPGLASAQTKDDTIVYSLQSDVDSWDPPASVLREAIILGYHAFDHLATRDLKTRRVGPNLATSWRNIDDTTWEVKLRQGVKFHDGTPFTAKDVKATFDRVLDPAKKMTARGNHAKIKTVEVVDDFTVRFKTDGPYPLFVERLTAQVMQSEKVIREKGDQWMGENPIGTGPYKLVKWNRKQDHLLVRNDDYWGAKPHYKYLRVRIIPEKATEIAELLSGGVDVIKAVPPDQMDVIEKSGAARTGTSPILRTAMLQLDQAARGGPNPFTDRKVRQAANLAVDSDSVIKHVLNGLGDRVATGINPMAFGWDPSLKPYKQDLAAAKKLLAEAGYPNGFDAGDYSVDAAFTSVAEAAVNSLQTVGFRAKVRPLERAAFFKTFGEKKLKGLVQGGSGAFGNAATRLEAFVASSGVYAYGGYPDIDGLFREQAGEIDRKRRETTLHRIQQLVHDRAMFAPIYQISAMTGVGPRVEESGIGLVAGYAFFSSPYEDVKLKGK